LRPLIIVGAAKIDQLLTEILRQYLLPKFAKVKEQDELLEGDNPLTTFSSRIKICCRLGLLEDRLFATLNRLRLIRNLCAHQINFDASKSPIREHLNEFYAQIASRPAFKLTKERFFNTSELSDTERLQCSLLTLCVLLEATWKCTRATTRSKAAQIIATK
jgi:DNA-binding MltR family transcriptional regulator